MANIPSSVLPGDGSDLQTFVTRPDLRPPKLIVQVYEPHLLSQGYWFVSPYKLLKEREASTVYQPLQTGPHIYDEHGDLIWSGSHLVDGDRAVFDFKVLIVDGVQRLSLLLLPHKHADYLPSGAGLILDSSLNVSHEVRSMRGSGIEDMHEFNVIENGKRALMITHQSHYRQFSRGNGYSSRGPLRSIGNPGFVEVDVETGEAIFEWWAIDHILPIDSVHQIPDKPETTWDWLHLNSVDKNEDGDYLISSRYTNTIYKISRLDGSIIWRLGGQNSSFTLQGFNFSGQHDARFRGYHGTTEQISFLDNAASDVATPTSTYSTGLLVSLDTATMTANLLKAFPRPDKQLSELRGNLQMLPDSNVLINWSDNGFMTEHTADGRHILDVQFASHRFTTYRGYKFKITLTPADEPVVKAFVYGQLPNTNTSTAVFYASWNGATAVASWRFFASATLSGPCTVVGEVPRAGFETQFMTIGYYRKCFVRAIGIDGSILGESAVGNLTLPSGWDFDEEAAADFYGEREHYVSNAPYPSRISDRVEKWSKLFQSPNLSDFRSLTMVYSSGLILIIVLTWMRILRMGLWNRCFRPLCHLFEQRSFISGGIEV